MSSFLHLSLSVNPEDTWGGLATDSGLLRQESSSLVLEFETRNDVLQVLTSSVNRLCLGLKDIEARQWSRGWIGRTPSRASARSVLEESDGP